MDDECTGLGLYRAQDGTSLSPHGTHELAPPQLPPRPNLSSLAGTFVHSVTILEPLFPHLKVTKGPSCKLAIGAPSQIIDPFMFRPIGDAEV